MKTTRENFVRVERKGWLEHPIQIPTTEAGPRPKKGTKRYNPFCLSFKKLKDEVAYHFPEPNLFSVVGIRI